MKILIIGFLLAVTCLAIIPVPGDITDVNHQDVAVTRQLVDRINAIPGNTWTASVEQGSTISRATLGQVKSLLGVKAGGPKLEEKTEFEVEDGDVPDEFDSRTHWPQCPTISMIRDQSACGTCWAFGAAEAISDRYCTYGVNKNLSVAAGDIGFCCGFSCGDGCDGGYPSAAWSYWARTGVVDEDCYPYPFPSCDHHVPNSQHPCPSNEYPTPKCPKACKNGKTWQSQKHMASKSYSTGGENNIMKEIFANGPVETAFSVYQDFLTYKTGVYKRTSNVFLGGHAVKFVGWGVEDGTKYWLVANSWNPSWGDQGYFKIVKGSNECGIEASVNAGVPKN
jgi:C1A family cysteine protease